MKILITGAAGFIGSNFVRYLLDSTDHTILGIDNLSWGRRENLPVVTERFGFHRTNLLDHGAVQKTFEFYKPDVVYHMAGFNGPDISPSVRLYNYEANLLTTASVLNACVQHEVKRLVYLSSEAVYGHTRRPWFERDHLQPETPYALAKMVSEMDIRNATSVDHTIIRLGTVYGPREADHNPYRNHLRLPDFEVAQAINAPYSQYLIYVDDIMQPLLLAMETDAQNQTINITNAAYECSKAAAFLRYIPGRTSVEKGQKEKAEWKVQVPALPELKFDKFEITKK